METITMTGAFAKLPVDISMDILSRLPLNTISQCRWVSKAWYDLVHSSSFAKVHYAKINKSPFMILWDDLGNDYLIDNHAFETLATSTIAHSIKFRTEVDKFYDVVGRVNGLACLSSMPAKFYPLPYCICNIHTGEIIMLPDSPRFDIAPISSGFGFDSVTEEYKVIRIWKKSCKLEAEVYAQGSRKWRLIRNVPNIAKSISSENIFLNGSMHWLTGKNGYEGIISFDVGREEFNVIKMPPDINVNTKSIKLEVLGECLSLIDTAFSGEKTIWVMKRYGIDESWVMEYVLRIVMFMRLNNIFMIFFFDKLQKPGNITSDSRRSCLVPNNSFTPPE
ncbi:hypothetical protein AQUCO_05600076v1 [Aquilegia coerulea]|uniref:F-box domain-containing protein n=1 Tax=Aquilegia coerulea TaxID=218851 RepID=A0A2G5CGH6_AQUCA|nr:hypothetical protein AQUCO_05600076v1 [Aquilegia coerulea]